jgi:hypothetical protein
VIGALSQRRISYLHLIEGRGSEIGLTDDLLAGALNNAEVFRAQFPGPLISAAAYTPPSAAQAIEKGVADAIAFGRLFIANSDLVERIAEGYPLNRMTAPRFTESTRRDMRLRDSADWSLGTEAVLRTNHGAAGAAPFRFESTGFVDLHARWIRFGHADGTRATVSEWERFQ